MRAVAPTGLPVEAVVEPLRAALADPGLAVLQAPPGAGKTTVVPLRLLSEPWLGAQRIVVLEPRRIAARAAAARMASLLGEQVGDTIGYVTRDDRRVSRATRIEVVTEGVLTRRLQRDPSLEGTGLVALDEVHERNLQGDLALALLLDVRPALRPDLRILAMSATIAAERFAAVLGGADGPAPIVASEGRAFDVDLRWRPPRPRTRIEDATADAVRAALREEHGDVLVFLPGAGAIRQVESKLRGSVPSTVDVRPLFGVLSGEEQDAALAPPPAGRRRVVLATDIAETSLTVDGVRVVVDAGLSRTPRYDPRTGLTRLQTGPISKSSAEQRSGRAGRTEPGVAYRLWSKLEHAGRRPFPDPEIAKADLAGLALDLALWGTAPSQLAFVDQPPSGTFAEAVGLLTSLTALDEHGKPTRTGRAMAELPLHPRLARMVVEAAPGGRGWEACVVAALLEERDVLRGRPDELPTDLLERVRLIADRDATHPRADRGAVFGARRRARQLADRAGVSPGRVQTDGLGQVLALAYPDRIGQARGATRVRLRGGGGAVFAAADPLAGHPLVVVAELDEQRGKADARIRIAAAVDEADVLQVAGDQVEEVTTLTWDPSADDLRRRTERRLGLLVLGEDVGAAEPGDATIAALLGRVRATKLRVLHWTDAARSLQDRTRFLRDLGDDWPDLSDAALLDDLDRWLAPMLPGATGRADLERVDVFQALLTRVGHHRRAELDRLAPTHIDLPSGRRIAVDYTAPKPTISTRAQDLFGTTVHPTVADGRVPLTVALLSPAGRPIQVTADLPGLWAGSWADVRKDMAGRYPKHDWPQDPSTA